MAKRSGNRLIQSDALSAGRAQARQAEAWTQQEQTRRSILPLASIQPRPSGDSRPLKPDHVLNLAESIAAIGLVEPPTVDRLGRLLAGAHRIAALRLLAHADIEARIGMWLELINIKNDRLTSQQQSDIDRLKVLAPLDQPEIPVMILPFDAAEDPATALAVETSENTQRRSYSRQEIITLATRLKDAGFIEREGRPRAGEKALRPALSLVLGKSDNTVRRWLGVLHDTPKTCPNGQVSGLQDVEKKLLRAIRNYRQASIKKEIELKPEVSKILEEIEFFLSK